MHSITSLPAAGPGAPSYVIPFPTGRARPPCPDAGLLDKRTWDRCFVQAHVADQFRAMADCDVDCTVHEMLAEQGSLVLAKVLEENAGAAVALRAILATLLEADRRLAAAVDRALQAEGL